MIATSEVKTDSVARAACAIAGSALVFVGLRERGLWGYLLAIVGAAMIRRGIAGGHRAGSAPKTADEKIDEMSMQSFPASDAPTY